MMNEVSIPRNNGSVMREYEPWAVWTGRDKRDGVGVHYFTQQRIGEYSERESSSTLMARDYKGASDLVVESTLKPQRKYIVRRLTPLETTRLQGMPDTWFDGVKGSDSAIYKACGNGLALPCAYDVMNRIANFIRSEELEGQEEKSNGVD